MYIIHFHLTALDLFLCMQLIICLFIYVFRHSFTFSSIFVFLFDHLLFVHLSFYQIFNFLLIHQFIYCWVISASVRHKGERLTLFLLLCMRTYALCAIVTSHSVQPLLVLLYLLHIYVLAKGNKERQKEWNEGRKEKKKQQETIFCNGESRL